MSTGMVSIIAAHQPRYLMPGDGADAMECECERWRGDTVEVHAVHVADELTRGGYGNVHHALMEAADVMPIETLGGADKASAWLRHRAHAVDPAGRALVQAIHDRKAHGNILEATEIFLWNDGEYVLIHGGKAER